MYVLDLGVITLRCTVIAIKSPYKILNGDNKSRTMCTMTHSQRGNANIWQYMILYLLKYTIHKYMLVICPNQTIYSISNIRDRSIFR